MKKSFTVFKQTWHESKGLFTRQPQGKKETHKVSKKDKKLSETTLENIDF